MVTPEEVVDYLNCFIKDRFNHPFFDFKIDFIKESYEECLLHKKTRATTNEENYLDDCFFFLKMYLNEKIRIAFEFPSRKDYWVLRETFVLYEIKLINFSLEKFFEYKLTNMILKYNTEILRKRKKFDFKLI